jgi:hypothetical protein
MVNDNDATFRVVKNSRCGENFHSQKNPLGAFAEVVHERSSARCRFPPEALSALLFLFLSRVEVLRASLPIKTKAIGEFSSLFGGVSIKTDKKSRAASLLVNSERKF